jgi:hypothetical protein
MELVAVRRIKDRQKTGAFLMAFAILLPIVNAGIGVFVAKLLNISQGFAWRWAQGVAVAVCYGGFGTDKVD